MKHLIALAALAGVLAIGGMVDAAGYPGGGKVKPTAEGTITDVGSRGFQMTLIDPAAHKTKSDDAPAPPGKTVTVLCDNNTKFQTGEEAADGSIVKIGAHVAITGSQSGVDTFMATVVSLVSEHKKKK